MKNSALVMAGTPSTTVHWLLWNPKQTPEESEMFDRHYEEKFWATMLDWLHPSLIEKQKNKQAFHHHPEHWLWSMIAASMSKSSVLFKELLNGMNSIKKVWQLSDGEKVHLLWGFCPLWSWQHKPGIQNKVGKPSLNGRCGINPINSYEWDH